MNRLIDMMTDVELSSKVLELFSGSPCLEKGWKRTSDLKQGLEALFAPIPHWSDSLGKEDNQTWEFCFVSDHYPADTRQAKWIARAADLNGGYRDCVGVLWKYATPVDLGLRYNRGDE